MARQLILTLVAVLLVLGIFYAGYWIGASNIFAPPTPTPEPVAVVPTGTGIAAVDTATAIPVPSATTTPVAATAMPTMPPALTASPTPSGPPSPTATPRPPAPTVPPPPPTATPLPTIGPERVIIKEGKIGVGVYYKGGNYIRYETFRAKPGVILLFEPDVSFAKEIRNLFPKAFIVGRRDTHARDQSLDNPTQRGSEYADFVARLAVPLKDTVDAWISYNEPVRSGDFNAYRAYNEFQVAFANKLQNQYGIAAVAGNDAPGAIDIPDYPKYFAEAIRASKYLGVHAYTTVKATTFREKDVDWYILRYRKYHEALEAAGIKDVKMIITEVAFVDGWQRRNINADQMAEEYLWLANETYKDPYMVGYAAYGLWLDPGQWFTYQLSGTRVLDYMGAFQPPAGAVHPR